MPSTTVGNPAMANQSIERGQPCRIAGLAEILNVSLDQDQRRVLVAANARNGNAVVFMHNPQIGNGFDGRAFGGHDKLIVGQRPMSAWIEPKAPPLARRHPRPKAC